MSAGSTAPVQPIATLAPYWTLAPSRKIDKPHLWLGKYLSLALTLPACVVAGYILGSLADRWLHLPILRAIGIFLGMGAGVIQIIRELDRDAKRS